MKFSLVYFLPLIIIISNPCVLLAQSEDYFQQRVNYKISVELDDINHMLHGRIDLFYFNNSPDILDKIAIHLWPNAYSSKKTSFAKQKLVHRDLTFYDADKSQRGWIDSLNFVINKKNAELVYDKENTDIAWIHLPEPLLPGKAIKITSPFRVKIPASFSRLGHQKNAYQITQWYPKPAVYDKNGWQTMPYLDQGEFYSNFGNFEVEITLPAQYIVAATGTLQEQKEIAALEKHVAETENFLHDSTATVHYFSARQGKKND